MVLCEQPEPVCPRGTRRRVGDSCIWAGDVAISEREPIATSSLKVRVVARPHPALPAGRGLERASRSASRFYFGEIT